MLILPIFSAKQICCLEKDCRLALKGKLLPGWFGIQRSIDSLYLLVLIMATFSVKRHQPCGMCMHFFVGSTHCLPSLVSGEDFSPINNDWHFKLCRFHLLQDGQEFLAFFAARCICVLASV